MYSFESDYTEGAHSEILRRLCETNLEQLPGYGHDSYCESAKEKIRAACGCPDAQVTFITGGTQTNQIVIASVLKLYEGVISAASGHINVHESGAVEYTGHKVLPLPQYEGKIKADDLLTFLKDFYNDSSHEHMVLPGMVYISHPTEYGTLYNKAELEAISSVCREYNMPLFLDGARLGYGLMSYDTDVTLKDIAALCDIFYIGGTKVGALCGEAVVFTKNNMPAHFENLVKKHGALLAKGRLLGVQFDTLFTNDLYFSLGKHAIDAAEKLKAMFKARGYKFFINSPTNQQFIILENKDLERLRESVRFSFWEKYDENHTVVRFATSWATTDDALATLEKLL